MNLRDPEALKHVADILMAAAYADGTYQRVEGGAVRQILAELSGQEVAPKALLHRLDAFDPDSFELEPACAALALEGVEPRRELLQLVARVADADEVHDLDESAYIVQVARAIGASPEDYAGLTLELLASVAPPPIPPRR